MIWKEIESDVQPGSLRQALKKFDGLSAVHAVANLTRGVRIYCLEHCRALVLRHVNSSRVELGGLLLGVVFQHASRVHEQFTPPLTIITKCVPSLRNVSSPTSLKMNTEVWDRSHEKASKQEMVVGWYHSHPNLGAFFSTTDRWTQRSFFNQRYSLGWVIDPVRVQHKVYWGEDSCEYEHPIAPIKNIFGRYRELDDIYITGGTDDPRETAENLCQCPGRAGIDGPG